MGIVEDMVSRLEVRVTSPDRNIQAKLSGRGKLEIGFRGGSYRKYSEDGVAAQLSDVLTRVGQGYRTAMGRIVEADFGGPPERREEWDSNRRRFLAKRRAIEAHGVSPNNCFRVRLTNMSTWTAEVRSGTLATTRESSFVSEILGAVTAALNDFSGQEQRLKHQHGMNLHVGGI